MPRLRFPGIAVVTNYKDTHDCPKRDTFPLQHVHYKDRERNSCHKLIWCDLSVLRKASKGMMSPVGQVVPDGPTG